jgi:hypothetical protein
LGGGLQVRDTNDILRATFGAFETASMTTNNVAGSIFKLSQSGGIDQYSGYIHSGNIYSPLNSGNGSLELTSSVGAEVGAYENISYVIGLNL